MIAEYSPPVYGSYVNSSNYPDLKVKSSSRIIGPFNTYVQKSKQKNPFYKSQIAAGQDATTDYSVYSTQVELEPGRIRCSDKDQWGNLFFYDTQAEGYYVKPASGDKAEAETIMISGLSAENAASMAIREKVHEIHTKYEGSTFIGTIFETWEGMKNPGKALFDGFKNFESVASKIARETTRSGKLRYSAAELHALLGGLWLEWNFGWAPLISDIQTMAEALAYMTTTETGIIRVQGNGHEDTSSYGPLVSGQLTVGGFSLGNMQLVTRKVVSEKIMIQFNGGVYSSLDLNDPNFGTETLGLTMEGFVPTVYELTPWSFLLDYFSNIGDYLNTLVWPDPAYRFLSKSVKIERRVTRTAFARNKPGTPVYYTIESSQGGSATTVRSEFTRRKGAYPIEVFRELKIPEFGKKWINMASLLRPKRL